MDKRDRLKANPALYWAESDWKARALAAEHSVGVLTAQLEVERARREEVETIWDRDKRAAMALMISAGECEGIGLADLILTDCETAGKYADAMEAQRKARLHVPG